MNDLKVVITDYVCMNNSENKKVNCFMNMVSFMINTVTEIFSEAAMFIAVAIFTVASVIMCTARFSDMKDASLKFQLVFILTAQEQQLSCHVHSHHHLPI